VILFALYVALAVGLRRGSAAARVGAWVVCGLGVAAGCGAVVTVTVQRGASDSADGLLVQLASAYPGGWVGLNVSLSVAQMLGYLLVAGLLAVTPRAYFRPGAAAAIAPNGTQPYRYQPEAYVAPPPTPAPAPGPDDDYWARPT
jgi:hypothetical protein